ncbi:hypothetical protein PV378_13610 [Streptomyces scabiei]|uniref:hypothetical protein n=1 Tax=Streptomyces scabiei TaxID=1930 RepID=UPI0029AA0CD9|nr:hypothetical protein [Streptomyces scabiei]MDX3047530.1 hypothetical protein [Streptomyces scabiei]
MTRKRLTEKQAQAVVDGATLAKAPDWRETSNWHVTAADGAVLVVIAPSYGGTGSTGRNGWRHHLAALGPNGSRDRSKTRDQAAVLGLAAWKRWATG